MSTDPEFEKRINNKIETIVETQANLQEAIAQLIQAARIQNNQTNERINALIEVARTHDGQIDRNGQQIAELRESMKEQRDSINALIRIVEGHLSNHP